MKKLIIWYFRTFCPVRGIMFNEYLWALGEYAHRVKLHQRRRDLRIYIKTIEEDYPIFKKLV